jgi:sugar phosphate isomerase/epimerase
MELGIFARTYVRPSLDGVFDAVAAHGLRSVQFNMVCAGLDPMPDQIPDGLADRVRASAAARAIEIAALSGTFNMAHPDPRVRERGVARLRVLAAACRSLGVPVITLCTGTRDPNDMWRRHPDNDSPAAWADLRATLEPALAAAAEHEVILAFEPEPANVVNSAARGRQLLDEVRNPRLAVVVDPANIVATDRTRPEADVLAAAFDLLGERIAVAHAKDLTAGGEPCAAGQGIVPWDRYLALLHDAGFTGPLILHGLAETEVPAAVRFLRDRAGDVLTGS